MKLTEDEKKFSINEKVGVFVEIYCRYDAAVGAQIQDGWRVLILRRGDIVAKGHGRTREHAFALAKARYLKVLEAELDEARRRRS